jgi:hypothetical protein
MENTFNLKRVGNMDVYFRNPSCPKQAQNQPRELERVVKFLTDEDFEDYKGDRYERRLKHPENFKVVDVYPKNYGTDDDKDNKEKYTCLCSENTCEHLMIVKHKPTKTYLALGSVCYLRFNEENGTEIYYHTKAKKCDGCRTPLISKDCQFIKNTNKKCDGKCFDCFKQKQEEERRILAEMGRVYLNVKYENKDDAKLLGAWWDADKKKWYAPNNSAKYKALIDKYH